MAEQEKQGQNQPAGEETGQSQTGSDNQGGQDKQEPGNASGNDPEQTGEGTGAKAGEYS